LMALYLLKCQRLFSSSGRNMLNFHMNSFAHAS
jgi:hypothetical protein